MSEYCNICGRKLRMDTQVVDTSLDMRPIPFNEVQGDNSDLICIDCAIEAVENPPIVCSRCGQPIEFSEKVYVFEKAVAKPAGPLIKEEKNSLEDRHLCGSCFDDIMGADPEDEDASMPEKELNLRVLFA
ncbi:MAG: hypothetical protein PHD41_04000 [Methanosarcinaceae archaeon]|nr:hypothetical protein [Methanosarcinaceae archaeon]MDD4332377.1 hypothetical protein [Methanosarcinaceae archaeon]MDD4749732.1 hypothetical protein [Methanosarcinaceae archaeon]